MNLIKAWAHPYSFPNPLATLKLILTSLLLNSFAALLVAMTSTPVVFFVPGAWHEPWVFDDVRSTLSDRGFETGTSALATVGSKNARVGVLDDAAVIRSALLELIDAGKEVVVVAHSYGGVVASNSVRGLSISQRAADGKVGGIALLLYLCAFVVPVETSLLMAVNNVFPDWWNVTEVGMPSNSFHRSQIIDMISSRTANS